MEKTIERIRNELKQNSDTAVKESSKRFFKEAVLLYGVKTALVQKTARRIFREIEQHGKQVILSYCDELMRSGYLEESFIACEWAHSLCKEYAPEDFPVLETWVRSYVSNWATCDTLCTRAVGEFLETYPAFTSELKKWAVSENRWMRRAAAVSLILPARKGRFLSEIFSIADVLLMDSDDLVQKGYGWMLKVAGTLHQKEVFDYVMIRKDRMPRTALRYAIEKMPAELKKRAMER